MSSGAKEENVLDSGWLIKSVLALAFFSIVLTGIKTELFLGDETWHFQLASTIYQTGERPIRNPLVHYSEAAQMAYFTDVLWHYGLVFFWRLTGGISQVTAQIYNAFYFLLLTAGTFLLARELYPEERELHAYSLFSALSIPMVPIFSVILHLDVAVAAWATLCLWMLARRQYLLAGVFLGLAVLMKRNVYLLVPAILLFTLFDREDGLKGWGRRLFLLLSPTVPILAPDAYFRIKNFGLDAFLVWPVLPSRFYLAPLDTASYSPDTQAASLVFYDVSNPEYSPTAILTHFGPLLFILLGLYLVRREDKKRDWFLLVPSLLALLLFAGAVLLGDSEFMLIRYLTPFIPLLAILGALGLASVNTRTVRYILLIGCLMQFVFSLWYVSSERRIPEGLKEAYAFIKESTPENARIMDPFGSQLAFYTGRISHWRSYCCYREMAYLFWQADEKETLKIMNRYGTNYVLVEKDNVYDDSKVRHLGRYPRSFVEKMKSFTFLKPVFENQSVSLWAITVDSPPRVP